MQLTAHEAMRVGELVSYTQDEDGRGFLRRTDPLAVREMPIGVATEAIPVGAAITWDVVKREGYHDGRRVIVACSFAS